MDGKAERRWLGTSPCDNERTIALRKNALRAYEGKSSELTPPGPRSRVGTIQLNWVSSAYCPNVTYLLFGGRKALCSCCWCGTPAESNGRFYSSGRSASTVLSGLRKASRSRLGRKQNLPNPIELYRLATAGPVVSAPRTSPGRLGVRLSSMQ